MCCDYECGSFTEGVGCMDIQLSDEPNLGTWTVNANHLIVSMPHSIDTCIMEKLFQ